MAQHPVRTFSFIAVTVGFLACTGCSRSGSVSVPGLTDTHATAIAFDADGNVMDFFHLTPGSGIERIEFLTPENGEMLFVAAVGPNVHEALKGAVAGSRTGDGMMGRVTVDIQGDGIVSIFGNTLSNDNPLTRQAYEQVRDRIRSGETGHSDRVLITLR